MVESKRRFMAVYKAAAHEAAWQSVSEHTKRGVELHRYVEEHWPAKAAADPAPTASGLNPRVALWLASRGLTVEGISRRSGEDLPQVTFPDGTRSVWTQVYSEWILAEWTAWAKSLGHKSHIEALRDGGRTDAEFDAWLGARHG